MRYRTYELCEQLISRVEEESRDVRDKDLAAALRRLMDQLRAGVSVLKEAFERQDEVEPGYDRAMECIGLLERRLGGQFCVDADDSDPDLRVIWFYERSQLPSVYSFLDHLDLAAFLEPFAYGSQTTEEFREALNNAPSALDTRCKNLLKKTEV